MDELTGYMVFLSYLKDAITAILFWRGQVPVMGLDLPLHSVYFFFAAITLAEHPSLCPSFFFLNIFWALFAIQIWRNSRANPWEKTKTVLGLLSELAVGKSISGPLQYIAAHQNEEAALAEQRDLAERVEKAKQEAEEYEKEQMRLTQEHENQLSKVGDQTADTDLSTGTGGGVSLDPMKFILYPIQQILEMVIVALRLVKNIMLWEEPYLAFLLAGASLVIGLVFLIVPWAFLFRWTSRIIAWLLFGPHMKLVDIYWYRKIENLTREERRQQLMEAFENQLVLAKELALQARIQRENTIKMKHIKEALHGSYTNKVPTFTVERILDFPTFESTAKPLDPSTIKDLPNVERVAGQHLVGTMIPKIVEDEDFEKDQADGESKKDK